MKLLKSTLLLLAAAALPAAADTECPGSESGRAKIDWIYTMPKPDALPKTDVVARDGAYILLDEVIFNGREKIYTLMAMVGDKESFDAFGNVEVQTGFDDYADIKARVQSPDGKIADVDAAAIRCSTTDFGNLGYSVGKSQVPRHYVFHFPGLAPGAVLQYQVNIRTHIHSKPDWVYWYSNLFNFRLGSQNELGFFSKSGVDPRTRYAANQVSYVLNMPRGIKYVTRALPEGAAVNISELKGQDSSFDKLLRITARRDALPYEPYAPYYGTDSPEVVVFVASTELNAVSEYQTASKDWNEWINLYMSDPVANTKPDRGAYNALIETSVISADAPMKKFAEHATRYVRDRVANTTGFEVRNSTGYRPPADVIGKSKTGSFFEKLLTLTSVLKARGIDARLVYVRAAGLPPIDRSLPLRDWFSFSHYLVSADIDGSRFYFDPVSKIATGTLPAYLQGGEAIVVKDRKTWEWVTLPVSAEADNLSRADLQVTSLDGGMLKGRLKLEFSGAVAEELRAGQELSQATLSRFFTDLLDGYGFQGAHFSNVTHENYGDPDKPLTLGADFEYANAVRKIGAKTLLRLLPLRIGPVPSTFGAAQRAQDIDFRIARRFEITVRLPRELGAAAALPEDAKLSGPGMDYERTVRQAEGAIVLQRRLSLHGRVPAAKYGEMRAFLGRLDEADAVELSVGK